MQPALGSMPAHLQLTVSQLVGAGKILLLETQANHSQSG